MEHQSPPRISPHRRGAARFMAAALATALALAAAPALMAQEGGWSIKNFGLQLGYIDPMGELADIQEPGFGAAVFYENVFSGGFSARGRLEYTKFGAKKIDGSGGTHLFQALTQIGAMVDAIYYHKLKATIYPFAGVGYFSRSVDSDGGLWGPNSSMYGGRDADLKSKMAACAGLGVNFSRHFGMEMKYTQCEFSWVQLALSYRF